MAISNQLFTILFMLIYTFTSEIEDDDDVAQLIFSSYFYYRYVI